MRKQLIPWQIWEQAAITVFSNILSGTPWNPSTNQFYGNKYCKSRALKENTWAIHEMLVLNSQKFWVMSKHVDFQLLNLRNALVTLAFSRSQKTNRNNFPKTLSQTSLYHGIDAEQKPIVMKEISTFLITSSEQHSKKPNIIRVISSTEKYPTILHF